MVAASSSRRAAQRSTACGRSTRRTTNRIARPSHRSRTGRSRPRPKRSGLPRSTDEAGRLRQAHHILAIWPGPGRAQSARSRSGCRATTSARQGCLIAVGRAAERSTAASCGNALHRACACAGSEYPAPATGRTHQAPLDLRRPLEIGNISAAGLHSPRAEQPSEQEAAGRSQVAAKRSSARRAIKCPLGRTSTASSQAPQPGDHK